MFCAAHKCTACKCGVFARQSAPSLQESDQQHNARAGIEKRYVLKRVNGMQQGAGETTGSDAGNDDKGECG